MSNRLQQLTALAVFICATNLSTLPLCAQSDRQTEDKLKQPSTTKTDTQSEEQSEIEADTKTDEELTAAQKERQRRLDSLKKAIEGEVQPDRPTFGDSEANRKSGAITFDDIKFEMKKGTRFKRDLLTDEINDLVGEKISIKGYIRPNNKNRGLKKFVFVRDDKECCFGPGAALYDCVLVSLAKGKESDFTVRPITIEGEFYLKEFNGPDKQVWAVYRMKNCRVVR